MSENIYLSEEVSMLKDQLRRFIETEVTPAGEATAWRSAPASAEARSCAPGGSMPC